MNSYYELPLEIIKDLWNHRWVMLFYLLIVVTLSATIVVTAKTKVEISKLQQYEMEEDDLENEWRNQILEEETLSEHSKVRDLVESEFNMIHPNAVNEQHLYVK